MQLGWGDQPGSALLAQAVAVAADGDDLAVVRQAVEEGRGRGAEPSKGNGSGPGPSRRPIRPTDLIHNPTGARKASISKNMEQAPEVYPLYEDEEIAGKDIVGKAARYFRETNILYIHMKYSAVGAAQGHLERRYADYEDPELEHFR